MEIKSIVFIGAYAKNTLHQLYDTGLLHASSLCSDKVVCYKDKSTFTFIKESEEKYNFGENIELRSIRAYAPHNKLLYVLGMLLSGLTSVFLLFKTKREDVVIYAYNNLFALHTLNLFNKFLHRKIVISCHGEMELLTNNVQGSIANIHRLILTDFFKKRKADDNIRFLLLGDSMVKNIQPYVSSHNIRHFCSIECPCYMEDVQQVASSIKKTIKIGVLGTLSPIKGLSEMISFIVKLKEKGIDFDFSVIGGVSMGNKKYSEILEKYNVNIKGGSLPRYLFEKEILNLDFVVFFYPRDSYKLIASGTLLDAIALNKPVIALKNDYFNYILKKTEHPSILCDNVDEMVDSFVEGRANDLYNMDFNSSKSLFSPVSISKQLQIVIDSLL